MSIKYARHYFTAIQRNSCTQRHDDKLLIRDRFFNLYQYFQICYCTSKGIRYSIVATPAESIRIPWIPRKFVTVSNLFRIWIVEHHGMGWKLYNSPRIQPNPSIYRLLMIQGIRDLCGIGAIPLFHTGPNPPKWHELTNIWIRGWIVLSSWRSYLIRTVRSEFLQSVGLSGIRLISFELFKTLATNSPIPKNRAWFVPNS